MLAKISLRERPEFTAAFPATRQAVVHITTQDGTVLTSPVTRARGDPDRPLSDQDVIRKFADLTAHLGKGRSAAIGSCAPLRNSDIVLPRLLDLVLTPLAVSSDRLVA